MTLQEVQLEGHSRWSVFGPGRGWHMMPIDKPEYFKLEWPDGVVRGQGDSWEAAFDDATRRESEAKETQA